MEIFDNNCQQFFGTDIDGEVIINGNVIRAAKEIRVKNNMVFINGKPVGGSDELHSLERAGKLDALLAA